MKIPLALFALAFAMGEAMGQTSLRSGARTDKLDVAQNLDSGSLAQPTANFQSAVLVLSPKVSTRPRETHAALALSNASFAGDITFRGRVKTVKQLRTGSLPNPWECVWVVWNYQANQFYYLALKTNGWEIGKHEQAVKGHQRFLKTGETPHAIGEWHDFEITQTQNEITVRINGDEVASFTDNVHPYMSGKLGFYTEDAEIEIDSVTEPFLDDFQDYPLHVHRGDGHVVKNWFMKFLGHGYAAISLRKK
jgi:hypothetical protein